MVAWVLLGLCLQGAVGASAPCSGGSTPQECAPTVHSDGGIHLLQHANVNSRVQLLANQEDEEQVGDEELPLSPGSEEEGEEQLLPLALNGTVQQQPPQTPLRLCHPTIVGQTCQKVNGGRSSKFVSSKQIQRMLAANASSVARLWRRLGLNDKRVECMTLCRSLVWYARKVGVLPPSSDRACFVVAGKARCDLDVSPHKLVAAIAGGEGVQPDAGPRVDDGDDVGSPALAKSSEQTSADSSQVGLVERSDQSVGRLVAAANWSHLGLAEGSGQGAGRPRFCPYSIWQAAETLANFFRVFPCSRRGLNTRGLVEVSLAQEWGAAGNVDEMIQSSNSKAKAWVSQVLVEMENRRAAAYRATWFGGRGSLSEEQVWTRVNMAMNFINRELGTVRYVYPADQASETSCTGNVAGYVWKSSSSATGYVETTGPLCSGSDDPMRKRCGVDNQGQYFVYLCRRWSESAESGRVGIIVHEAAHHTGPGDVTYDVSTMKNQISQAQQLDNAANYQYFAQDVANAAWGCVDKTSPNLPFSCNPSPCSCSGLAAYCTDATYGAQVSAECPATCGCADRSGPAPTPAPPAARPTPAPSTPSPAPPPPGTGGGGCTDPSGDVDITVEGTTYRASCARYAAAGYCTYGSVRSTCPATCGACPASTPAPAQPTPRPTPAPSTRAPTPVPTPQPPAGSCTDPSGNVDIAINGRTYRAPCSAFASAGYCTYGSVRGTCPQSCDACAGSSPTPAPARAPAPTPAPPARTPAPTPAPTVQCTEPSGQVGIDFFGTTYRGSCYAFASNGYCSYSNVRSTCPRSCNTCAGTSPARAPGAPAECKESSGPVDVALGGTTYRASCHAFASNGYCTQDNVRSKCPVSCNLCQATA